MPLFEAFPLASAATAPSPWQPYELLDADFFRLWVHKIGISGPAWTVLQQFYLIHPVNYECLPQERE